MEIIKPFINARLQLLNNSEPKDSIEDVVFIIKLSNGKILDSNIYLTPYEGLMNIADKEKAAQIVINKIVNKTYFIEKNIEYNDFNLILFFSFDILNLVDNCYMFDLESNISGIQIFDLNGNLILDKKFLESKIREHKIEVNLTPTDLYLFFDTETTGLPKKWKAPVKDLDNWPRLVQLAYLLYDSNGVRISEGNFIIKPDGFTISTDSSKIHGISTENAKKEGQPITSVLEHFNTIIGQANYLVAHNMSFDEKIVGSEFLRNGMQNVIQSKNKICTMERTTNFCAIDGPYGYKWPKLSELHYKLFRTGFEESHNAAVDITATAKCFWELRKRGII